MKAAADKLSLSLRAIADPTRRRILHLLHSSPARPGEVWTASEIGQRIRLAQPTISHHMKILHKAGLIECRKQGTWVRYRRIEAALRAIRKGMQEEL